MPVVNAVGATGPAFTVDVPIGAAVSCTVYNRGPLSADLTVRKRWLIDGAAYADGSQPAGFAAALSLSGPGAAGASPQPWGATRGGYLVGERATIDETTTLPRLCRLARGEVTEVSGAAPDAALLHTLTLAEGANSASGHQHGHVRCPADAAQAGRQRVRRHGARDGVDAVGAGGRARSPAEPPLASVTDALAAARPYRLGESAGHPATTPRRGAARRPTATAWRPGRRQGVSALARGDDADLHARQPPARARRLPPLTLRKLASATVVTAGRIGPLHARRQRRRACPRGRARRATSRGRPKRAAVVSRARPAG